MGMVSRTRFNLVSARACSGRQSKQVNRHNPATSINFSDLEKPKLQPLALLLPHKHDRNDVDIITRLWSVVARFSSSFYIERPTLQPSVADFILRDMMTSVTSAVELKSGLIQGLNLGIPAYASSRNAPRTQCTLGPYNCWDFLICRVHVYRMIVLSRDEIPRGWFWFSKAQIDTLRQGYFWFIFKDDADLEAYTIKTTKDEELAYGLEKVFLRYKAERRFRA